MLELNKIYCMDCLEGMKQIDDNSVDLIVSDPPYNINFKPQRGTFEAIENDNMSWHDFDKFMQPIINECFRVLKNNSVAYFFTGVSSSSSAFYNYAKNAGFEVKTQIVWVKNNFGIGYHFRPQHEDIWVCFKGKPPLPKRAMSTVLLEKKVYSLTHSCEKPVLLIQRFIKQYSKEDDLILDPFMGSGSAAVAAKQLGRKFIGFEIDPNFAKMANDRIKSMPVRLNNFLEVFENDTKTADN